MQIFQLGKPFEPGVTSWPKIPQFRLSPYGNQLVLFYAGPTATEIYNVNYGRIQFAWVAQQHIGHLCFRFGSLPWGDAGYEAHREVTDYRGWAATWRPGTGAILHIPFVDATTGILEAYRIVELPPGFVASIRDSIVRQLAEPFDPEAAQRETQRLYAQVDGAHLATLAEAACVIPEAVARGN